MLTAGSSIGALRVTARESADRRPAGFPFQSSVDLRPIIREGSCDDQAENGRSQLGCLRTFSAKFPTVAHGSPRGDRTGSHGVPADGENL